MIDVTEEPYAITAINSTLSLIKGDAEEQMTLREARETHIHFAVKSVRCHQKAPAMTKLVANKTLDAIKSINVGRDTLFLGGGSIGLTFSFSLMFSHGTPHF